MLISFTGSRRLALPAAAFCLVAAASAGCASVFSNPADRPRPTGVADSTDPITAQRAQYVQTMLSNSYAAGPETQSGIMSVIAGYGGGYVTEASLADAPGASEELTMNVVLGAGSVLNTMQGETDLGPSGIACFTFTVGDYYAGNKASPQVPCPASLTTADAQATAERQISTQVDSEQFNTALTVIPTTLVAAEQAVGIIGPSGQATTAPAATTAATPAATTATGSATAALTAADFATGKDGIEQKPDAGLAVPQPDGSCVYVDFRWIQTSWVGGGTAGANDAAVSKAWAAPTEAKCTGSAALAAGAFLTADRYAGG